MSSNLKVNNILPSTGDTVAISGIVSATSNVSVSGRLGIGITNPDGFLEIYNSSASGNTVLKVHNDKTGDAANITLEGKRTSDNDTGQVLFKNNNYSVAAIFANAGGSGNHDGGYLKFMTSEVGSSNVLSERLRITSDGKLGISHGSPSSVIHVVGNNTVGTSVTMTLQTHDTANATAGINLLARDNSNNNETCKIQAAAGGQETVNLQFHTNDTEKLRIRSTGEVSLGDVDGSSSSALHIRSVTSTETTLELSTKGAFNGSLPDAKISFTQQNGTEIARIKCDTETGAANMADLTFWTNYGGLYERMKITKSGPVIIHSGSNAAGSLRIGGNYDSTGTTNATAKLGTLMMPHYTNAEEPIQMIRGYSDSSKTQISIGGGTNSANGATEIILNTSSSVSGTASERFKIDSSGNTTIIGDLQVDGSGTSVRIEPTDGLINFGMDGRTSFVTGTNACYIYSGSGASGDIPAGTLILQSRSNVNRDIVMVTGTTPTERLRITSSGEVGISTNTNNTSVLNFKNSVKDHKIGGVTVELADDTISSDIMLPGARHGCLLFIFAHSDSTGTYPQPGPCGMVYVDVGNSTLIRPMYTQGGTGADATTTVGNAIVAKFNDETDINNCDDGKLTVMRGSANGRIKLANRLDSTYYFYLTMM